MIGDLRLRKRQFIVSLLMSWAGLSMFCPLLSQAGTLAEIRQRQVLIVAVKDNQRPLGFRDARGQLQGFEIEIAHRLAQALLNDRAKVRLIPIQNSDRLAAVVKGRVDLVIAGVTMTTARSRVVAFSQPYYYSGTGIITRDVTVQTLQNLSHASIAVLKESSSIAPLQYALPQANLIPTESYQAGKILLETGKSRAFGGDRSVLAGWVQEFPHYRLLPNSLSTTPFAVVMPKGVKYDQLRQQVNAVLDHEQKSGWLKQQAIAWGLP
jgi:polar amino acid transport system substrate-binding protein